MASVAAAYVLVPGVFLAPFAFGADPSKFAEIQALAAVLLRFVAVYSVFDSGNIIFAAGVKGAGDTRYVMAMLGVFSVGVLVIPSFIAVVMFDGGVYAVWTIATIYIMRLFTGKYHLEVAS